MRLNFQSRTPPQRLCEKWLPKNFESSFKTAIDIQTADRTKNFSKTFFLSPGGQQNFGNDSLQRCDRFCQIFVQIGAILAIFRPFEIFRAVWISMPDSQWVCCAYHPPYIVQVWGHFKQWDTLRFHRPKILRSRAFTKSFIHGIRAL